MKVVANHFILSKLHIFGQVNFLQEFWKYSAMLFRYVILRLQNNSIRNKMIFITIDVRTEIEL